ncbi:MAG TPA: helix-turn-helix domain-containing protein [Firmicutes bacterium]|nr:helix-turn-helix domain-containing protein [Bacillota bacterium]
MDDHPLQVQALPAVLRAPDVAKILGCSRSTVYELCHQQKIPHIRLTAHRLIIPRDALILWLQTCGEFRITEKPETSNEKVG